MSHLLKLKKIILGFCCGLALGGILFYISRSYYEFQQFKKKTYQNIVYWKSIAGEFPQYPDSWVMLSINWHKLGKNKFADLAIKKAAKLDPINDNIKDLKQKLKK